MCEFGHRLGATDHSTYVIEKTFSLCTNRLSVQQADDAFHVLRGREFLISRKVH